MTWYHGGRPRLLPGELLLPPAVTGVEDTITSGRWTLPDDPDRAVLRPDRVYLTMSRDEATLFAGLWTDGIARRGGSVYAVEPIGDLDPDPDYRGTPRLAWMCESARIIAVVRAEVKPGQLQRRLT